MQQQGIILERHLYKQQQELLLQQLFTASSVPESLIHLVRSFQLACIESGVEDKLNFKDTAIKRCEIRIGAIHLDLTVLNEQEVKKYLSVSESTTNEQAAGQIAWQFSGVNQFGALTIRVQDRSWQVEFSRLQRRISRFITDEATLKPKAHQAIYEEMKKALQPLAFSEAARMLILQGSPGLGKSYCAEHYFYHEAQHQHQMVAWLCGESKEAFLRDWTALANQLRCIDSKKKADTDTALVHDWCGEQLGQWLFIVDDLQIELDWLKQYLPQKGGYVLITTAQACFNLAQPAKILSFAPLSAEDSKLLLKAGLGKEWEATGHPEEVQALNYFSQALGGSPALLTQIALLVRKKGLSFARVRAQFDCPETRRLLLADNIFDQLKDQTFLSYISKGWRQWVNALSKYYPQFTYQQHEAHLKQFIDFLKQQVAPALAKAPQAYMEEEAIITYWQRAWANLAWVPLNTEQLRACLNLLPLAEDNINHRWAVTLAALDALTYQESAKNSSFAALPKLTAKGPVQKTKLDLPRVPAGINLSVNLENSRLDQAEIALLTTGKPTELTTWRLPTSNPYFIPRPALSVEITQKLLPKNNDKQSTELILAAASGMGGIGKTELARHFINTAKYHKRFWFNAANITALRNEFYDLASGLGLIGPKEYLEDQALIQRLHRWFNLNPGWLMVLDNADDYNNIAQWIPKEGGSVLVTTREPSPGTVKDKQIIRVPLLSSEEAVNWLYRLAQRNPDTASETEQQAASRLVENLGYLPLAIAQAAAYLREQTAVSIEAYQQNFLALLLEDESLIRTAKTLAKDSDAYSRRIIASTWQLSLQMIEAHFKQQGRFNACYWLLAACAYLAPKDIPLGLLEGWFKTFFDVAEIPPSRLSYLLDEYMGHLLRYSLCERMGLTSMFSMHRLVQEVLQASLIESAPLLAEQNELSIGKYLESTAKKEIFPTLSEALIDYSAEFTPSIADRKRRIDLIAHLEKLITAWEALDQQDEISREMLILLYGRLAGARLGLLADAKAGVMLYQKQLALCEKQYGPEHLNVAITLSNLGIAHGDIGDARRQKCLLEMAVGIKERHYGAEHPEVASELINLGNAYGDLGNPQQKKSYLEKALPIIEKHYGPKSTKVSRALMSLGNVYGYLGNAQQSKNHLERALGIDEDYYGFEHPEVAKTLANLAIAHGGLGEAQQQKSLIERALAIIEKYYGPEHPIAARMLTNLGNAYGDLGDMQRQKCLHEKALLVLEQFYGPEHPEIATMLISLGGAYGALGAAQQSKNCLEKALSINEKYYGSKHPEVAKVLVNLSNTYSTLGNAQQQQCLLKRALPILERHYGSEHPQVARALTSLGCAYGASNNPQQKKNHLERALSIMKKHYSPKHPEIGSMLVNLGNAYGALGKAQQQKKLLEEALFILEHSYGPKHPEIAKVLVNLSNAQGKLGNIQQQKCLLEKALFIFEQHYGFEHFEVAKVLLNLGITYGDMGEAQQQKRLLERVLPIFEQHYGVEHPEVARVLVNLSNAHRDLCNTQQQKHLLKRALPILKDHYGSDHPQIIILLKSLSDESDPLEDTQQNPLLQPEQQFFAAVTAGHLNVVQEMIERQNFAINCRQKGSQRTALHLACLSHQKDLIAFLLAKLARFDLKDRDGKFAWEYVIKTPLLECFKTMPGIFTQKYSAALKAELFLDWGKVLRMAVANNQLADVRFLIEVKGIDVNSVDANPKTQYSALHLAVIKNTLEIAQYLISKGADIKALDVSQKTPFNYIKPEQEALLALFKLSFRESLANCRSKFEKCHL